MKIGLPSLSFSSSLLLNAIEIISCSSFSQIRTQQSLLLFQHKIFNANSTRGGFAVAVCYWSCDLVTPGKIQKFSFVQWTLKIWWSLIWSLCLNQFSFICTAPFKIKLSLGALQSQKPRARTPQVSTVARNLEQDPAHREEPSCWESAG